jgi:hypothetical protein
LRIDFLSAFTTIEVAAIRVRANGSNLFTAEVADEFGKISVAGDAQRLPHPDHLRLKVTGPDPQLYLPSLARVSDARLRVELRLHVCAEQ